MYGHGATCRTSGASRPTPSAPALAASAERHQASHVRSAAIDVRRAWSRSDGGSAGAAAGAASVVPPGVSMARIVADGPTDFHRPYACARQMDVTAPPDPPAADRPPLARGELRRRIVRGTAINAVALAAVDLVVLAQGLIVTRLLGPAAIGLYGIVTVTTMTIVGLKRVGVDEAFVAQDEPEQELEFQRAFTLELAISACFSLVLSAPARVAPAI